MADTCSGERTQPGEDALVSEDVDPILGVCAEQGSMVHAAKNLENDRLLRNRAGYVVFKMREGKRLLEMTKQNQQSSTLSKRP